MLILSNRTDEALQYRSSIFQFGECPAALSSTGTTAQYIYQPVPGFIARRVVNARKAFASSAMLHFERRVLDSYSLCDLLTNDSLEGQVICLIADAYEGKSTLLEQTAYEIGQSNSASYLCW